MNKSLYGTVITVFLVIVGLMICGYVVVVKKVIARIRRMISTEEMFGEEEEKKD